MHFALAYSACKDSKVLLWNISEAVKESVLEVWKSLKLVEDLLVPIFLYRWFMRATGLAFSKLVFLLEEVLTQGTEILCDVLIEEFELLASSCDEFKPRKLLLHFWFLLMLLFTPMPFKITLRFGFTSLREPCESLFQNLGVTSKSSFSLLAVFLGKADLSLLEISLIGLVDKTLIKSAKTIRPQYPYSWVSLIPVSCPFSGNSG